MAKLFVFGCSYSEDYKQLYNSYINPENSDLEKYKKFRGGELPNCWGWLLAQKLGYTYVNYAEGAAGNNQILSQFCDHSHEIEEGDMVIIGWSFMGRYRWADDRNIKEHTWRKMGPGPFIKYDIISQTTHEEICVNRCSYLYINEVYGFINLIDQFAKTKKFEIYYWSNDGKLIHNLPANKRKVKKFLCSDIIKEDTILSSCVKALGGMDIKKETNGVIEDYHMGESGHRIQAELFYKHITDFKIEIL